MTGFFGVFFQGRRTTGSVSLLFLSFERGFALCLQDIHDIGAFFMKVLFQGARGVPWQMLCSKLHSMGFFDIFFSVTGRAIHRVPRCKI